MNSSLRVSILFVLLWSSAYIAFELCVKHVEPATFVVVRTLSAAAILFCVVVAFKLRWPTHLTDIAYSAIVGILFHGIYAAGSFAAIHHGLGLGLCALILSLQPLLTLLLSCALLGERLTPRKSLGILIGLVGVSLLIGQADISGSQAEVVSDFSAKNDINLLALILCFISLFAISIGTIIQKRFCNNTALVPGTCIQLTAAALFMLPIALTFETMHINWSLQFVLGLSWLVVFVSTGAILLLFMLIQRGDAGTVASLFYLVTPLVAIQAWVFFDEQMTLTTVFGMVFCVLSVVVIDHNTAARTPTKLVKSSSK